jgi:hypothetical protein
MIFKKWRYKSIAQINPYYVCIYSIIASLLLSYKKYSVSNKRLPIVPVFANKITAPKKMDKIKE